MYTLTQGSWIHRRVGYPQLIRQVFNFWDAETQIHPDKLELTWTLEIHLPLIKNRLLAMCRPINESYECGHDSLSLVHRCRKAVQANQRCEILDSVKPELRHKLACYQCRQVMHKGQKIFVRRNEKVWVARRHFGKVPEKVDRSNCWERHHIPGCREMDSWIGRMWRYCVVD